MTDINTNIKLSEYITEIENIIKDMYIKKAEIIDNIKKDKEISKKVNLDLLRKIKELEKDMLQKCLYANKELQLTQKSQTINKAIENLNTLRDKTITGGGIFSKKKSIDEKQSKKLEKLSKKNKELEKQLAAVNIALTKMNNNNYYDYGNDELEKQLAEIEKSIETVGGKNNNVKKNTKKTNTKINSK